MRVFIHSFNNREIGASRWRIVNPRLNKDTYSRAHRLVSYHVLLEKSHGIYLLTYMYRWGVSVKKATRARVYCYIPRDALPSISRLHLSLALSLFLGAAAFSVNTELPARRKKTLPSTLYLRSRCYLSRSGHTDIYRLSEKRVSIAI